ncbi:hypothetical protein [Brevibacterium aurantiacum]|uniref:Uncharacterized protein n=1 Tax=Brevibacterium aurantiacum TaxID=273384 RepID=A0A556C4V8_BREAU|nr:hypothetical protein [Brevibacterium aurantiacum]TSI12431.1 hypothetical protein FO013_20055 [Brevibacterium aurantiacum]
MKRRLHRFRGLFLVVGVSAALSACAQGQSIESACQVVMDKERALTVNAKTSVRETVASILRGDDAGVSEYFVTTHDIIEKVGEDVTNEDLVGELENFSATLQKAEDELNEFDHSKFALGGSGTVRELYQVQDAQDRHTDAIQDAADQVTEFCGEG